MEIKKYDNAIKTFETIIKLNQKLTNDQAAWYLGLTYLKLNRRSRATEYLMRIEADSCLYSKQAREILRKLN